MNTFFHLQPVNVFLKRVVFTIFFLNTCFLAMAQLNSTSSQTIATSQTYTGASKIANGSTVTVSGGTTTFNGTLTVGNGAAGTLIVKSGAIVIVNGTLSIGTSSNGAVVIENGGQLIVNPGSASGTAAININSSAATALDIQTGGSVIVKAAASGNNILGMYQTAASNVTVAGALQIRGGGFKMDGTSKLTYSGSGNDTIIGTPNTSGAYFSNSTKLTVGSNVNLYISGDVKNDSNAEFAINGNVSINGNYQSGNNTANVTGTGTLTTTGSLNSDSYQGSVFGERYSCPAGPCGGSNVITSSNMTTCNGGSVIITGPAIAGAAYKWLVSVTSASSGFTNAPGANTGQNYSTTGSPAAQYTYYKRQYTLNGVTINSNTLTITSSFWVTASTTPAIGGASTVCTGSAITLTNSLSGGRWTSASPNIATVSSSGVVTGVSAGTSVITYSGNGCYTPSNKTITVSSCVITWTGATNSAWTTMSNWSSGSVPTASDSILIPAGVPNYPQISTSVSSYKTTVNSGASLTITSSGVLNAYGNIINNGTVTTNAGSTVAFKGSSAQTISGVPVLYNVQVANTSGGVALSSAVTLKGALTLTSGVLTTNANLTVNFDNGGNIAYNSTDAGSISGNVTGRRDVVARTHYISAPFNGVTSAQVGATTPLYYNNYWKMYAKNFATQGWTAVTDVTTAMPLGTGFSIALPNAAPLIFTGTYTHSYTLPATTYSNAAAGKYILIGNPYPSALDWTSAAGWTKTNVANAIYYWDAASSKVSSYVAGVSTNGGTQYIPAMQSFMVSTTGTGGNSSVAINNAARVSLQNPSFLRSGSDETVRIKITAANAEQWDDAVVRFNEMATNSFDDDWDAYKLLSRGPSPSVYTVLGEDIYSVNSVAHPSALPIIDLAVYIPADGNYSLTITNSEPATDYVLIDKKLGTENLLSGSDYMFSALRTDDGNRFQLQLRTSENNITTGTTAAQNNKGLQIHSTDKGFVVQTDVFGGSKATIEVLDMSGKSVAAMENTLAAGATFISSDLSAGAYLVKVTVDGNTFAGMISLLK